MRGEKRTNIFEFVVVVPESESTISNNSVKQSPPVSSSAGISRLVLLFLHTDGLGNTHHTQYTFLFFLPATFFIRPKNLSLF